MNFANVSKSGRGHLKFGTRYTKISRIWSVISRSLCSRGRDRQIIIDFSYYLLSCN